MSNHFTGLSLGPPLGDHLPALPCPMASRKTCRLDNGHCAGAAARKREPNNQSHCMH